MLFFLTDYNGTYKNIIQWSILWALFEYIRDKLKQQYEYIYHNSDTICIFALGCVNSQEEPCLNDTAD